MPTLYPLTAATALANLRIDLSDTAPAAYRWQDTDLNRAIDRALERYSQAAPLLSRSQITSYAHDGFYGFPPNAWYIDSVEYPTNNFPRTYVPIRERKSPLLAPPTAAPTVTPFTSGAIPQGLYTYAVTFCTPSQTIQGAETAPGPIATTNILTLNGSATISNIPTGGRDVFSRVLYRSKVGGGALYRLAQIFNNDPSAVYFDNITDAALILAPPADSSATAGVDQFELMIDSSTYPRDALQQMELTYAQKHTLSTAGTTVPERHWDVVNIGAIAYALEAYTRVTNDNFEWADGHLRDRVDDTKSMAAWKSSATIAMQNFEAHLRVIREEGNLYITRRAQWGDLPLHYERV